MNVLQYPLEQLIKIKNKRFEQALKVLEEKKELLKKEEDLLKKKEKERNDVLRHKEEKLQQLRSTLDKETTSDKIQQMKRYLEVVKERLLEKERAVKKQKEEVRKAEKEVEEAKKILFLRQKDLEKLQMHKKEWAEELRLWSEREEGLEQDEIGSTRYSRQKQENRKK
jgi:hypothetical protein